MDKHSGRTAAQENLDTIEMPRALSRDTLVIAGLFAITLAIRMTIAFQAQYPADDSSFFWMRQAESIITTGHHFNHDPLSWGGRDLAFPPFFSYIVAFAGLFGPITISAKILLNVLAACTTIFVYLISMHITGSRHVAALAGVVSAVTPVFIAETENITPYNLVIPLFALIIYSYLKLESKGWTIVYLLGLAALSFISPLAIIFVAGLIVYLVLTKIEDVQLRKEEPEIILFSIFFIIWSMLVQYKRPIITHGIDFIWQNIPSQILGSYFTDVNILTIITNIGLVPFAVSVFVTYRYLLRKQSLHATMLISMGLAIGSMLWLKLINPRSGYLLFGLILSILFALGYQTLVSWMSQTKFGTTHRFIPLAIFVLVVCTSLLPSITMTNEARALSQREVHIPALEWLAERTSKDATVLADPDEGHMINTISQRPTMIDSDFVLAPDSEERYREFEELTSTPIESTAIDILSKHNVQYVYISPRLAKRFSEEARWIEDTQCFAPLYDNTVRIYQVTCLLQKIA